MAPKFDGTGPAGAGPRTGGQRGNCKGARPTARPRDGRGRGMGNGRGGRSNVSWVDSGRN